MEIEARVCARQCIRLGIMGNRECGFHEYLMGALNSICDPFFCKKGEYIGLFYNELRDWFEKQKTNKEWFCNAYTGPPLQLGP